MWVRFPHTPPVNMNILEQIELFVISIVLFYLVFRAPKRSDNGKKPGEQHGEN